MTTSRNGFTFSVQSFAAQFIRNIRKIFRHQQTYHREFNRHIGNSTKVPYIRTASSGNSSKLPYTIYVQSARILRVNRRLFPHRYLCLHKFRKLYLPEQLMETELTNQQLAKSNFTKTNNYEEKPMFTQPVQRLFNQAISPCRMGRSV